MERVAAELEAQVYLRIHTVHGNEDRMRIAMVCCGNMCPKGSDWSYGDSRDDCQPSKAAELQAAQMLGILNSHRWF